MKRKFIILFFDPNPEDKGGGDVRTQEQLLAAIQERINTALSTRATKDELAEIRNSQKESLKDFPLDALRAMADDKTGVMSMLAAQGLEITRLSQKVANGETERQDMSIRGQIKSWLELPNDEGQEKGHGLTVREAVAKIKAGNKVDLRPLEIRTSPTLVDPMTPTTMYQGSVYLPKPEIQPGIIDIVRVQPTFWDFLKKGATNSAAYVWVNKSLPAGSGEAAFIAPGVYKPNIKFQIGTEISNAKKIAASEKVAIELLDDIDGLASWVEDELMYQLKMKLTKTLLTSDGDSTTPKGITNYGVAYAGDVLGIETTQPNNWDVIKACVTQFEATNFTGYPVTAFLNPVDFGNMVMTKANNQGQTFIPPVTGATIVKDNNIPRGYILVGCMDLYKILIYKGFTMMWGLENDDFTKNLRTVIGEMRLHQWVSANHSGAFIYDKISNIIDKLELPEPATPPTS